MNDLYTAILKAASHIESNPKLFDFGEVDIPHTCGAPGCALGWIHHFACVAGSGPRKILIEANLLFGGICDGEFYERMDELSGVTLWRDHASECARALRLYAAAYHAPAPLPYVDIPATVRAIFDAPVTA